LLIEHRFTFLIVSCSFIVE